jgi:hypothetical protein
MRTFLVTEANGYDGIGGVWVVAAVDEMTAKTHISKKYGIGLKYLSSDTVRGVNVIPGITETTILCD